LTESIQGLWNSYYSKTNERHWAQEAAISQVHRQSTPFSQIVLPKWQKLTWTSKRQQAPMEVKILLLLKLDRLGDDKFDNKERPKTW